MPQVKIVARNFMDMVASLPAMKLDKLYENSFICVAILRSLPPLAKQYVVRLLDIDGLVSSKFLEEWVLPCGISEHRVAVERLIQLRVLTETVDGKKEAAYVVNRTFQHNLRRLVHGGVLPREPMPSNITVRLPSLEDLDAYAVQQWELFLLRVINSSEAEKSTNISSSMLKTFQRGLLRQKDDKEPAKLTESGFQFLLLDANAQLWYIVREYITNCEEHGVDTADLISFLLELSFHVTGKAYNLNTLSDRQRSIVNDLGDLGLVKLQQGRKESWFIPTKYATNLSISLADTSSRKEGYVVVETNFRIYAYSTSKLHCEILRLFSRIEYQLPNLIVGSITNESLKEAFENGIAAEQIVSFLQQNARPPRVAERLPSVPENVTDMIRLWEAEMNRVDIGHAGAGVFDELPSQDVFEAACNFARENGGLLWGNSKEMRIVVKGEIYEEMEKILVGDSKGNSNRKRSRKVEKILDEFSRVNSNSKRARKSFLCLS